MLRRMPEAPPLAPPPRAIPPSLYWRVRLGGVLPTIAWFMLTIGGVLATVFVGNSEWATMWRFRGGCARTTGTVAHIIKTDKSINNSQVMRVDFDFRALGQEHRARSYTHADVPAAGSTVEVEYVVDDPGAARIIGMRTAPFGKVVALILLFPLGATIAIAVALARSRRRLRLMQHGRSTWGILTDKSETSGRVNGRRVYSLTFAFVDEAGDKRLATDLSHRSEFFGDDVARHVLYAPDSEQACVADLIPGRPRTANGEWLPAGATELLRVLIPPAIAITAIALASYVSL